MKIIGLGGSRESAPIVAHLNDLGYEVIVVDQDQKCAAREYAAQFVLASCYDARRAVSALLAEHVQADGVLCCAVDAPHVAAEIARVLGLPGLVPERARLSVDKWRQNMTLREAGIMVPATRRIGEPWRGDASLAKKFVVKPNDLRGGRGVLVLDGTQFEDAQRIRISQAQALRAGGSGTLIMQEWIEGQQISTESIVVDGKVLFTAVAARNYDRLREFAPYVVEDGSDSGIQGHSSQISSLTETIERSCAALGWDNLTVKGDLILIENAKWVIIELAARLSGGYFASAIIPAAYGVDLIGAAAALAVGRSQSSVVSSQNVCVCQRYIFPEPADVGRRVVEVKAPGAMKLNGEIVSATIHVKAGDRIKPVVSHTERWGQVVTAGESASSAQKAAAEAVKRLKAGVKLA